MTNGQPSGPSSEVSPSTRPELSSRQQEASGKPWIRLRLDPELAHWIEDLVADERWYLVKEMKETKAEVGTVDPTQMSEVKLAERFLEYVRGSMKEAGWTNGQT